MMDTADKNMEQILKEYFFQKRHMLILLFSVFLLGLLLGGSSYWHSKRIVVDKMAEIAKLSDEKKEVLRKLAAAEVESRILRASQVDLKNVIQQREQEISEQATSLEFYRQLMVEDSEKVGLDINNYKITTTEDPQTFHFQLTFIQYAKNHLALSVELTITVEGSLKGQHVSYNFKELMQAPEKEFGKLSFKYFKVAEGYIKLPLAFMPQQIIVKTTQTKTNNSKDWERHLIWHVEEN
jgi:hypothetical protein